jgi:hypothetical protein
MRRTHKKAGTIQNTNNYKRGTGGVTQVLKHLPSPEFKPQYHQKIVFWLGLLLSTIIAKQLLMA